MVRKIITIDEEKCNGCGLCANACHEGAIGMIDGKAHLLRDDYCDGLGDCLPVCPTGAITFTEREAAAYDEAAVQQNLKARAQQAQAPMGCPGSRARAIERAQAPQTPAAAPTLFSQLRQWPVQIKLAPINAPYFNGANLLVAADCTAYAYANMHQDFMRGRITLIGCPKLDDIDYSEKLTAIIQQNDIKSVTIVRMEVPCCGGIEYAVRTALQSSGKFLPWRVVTVTTDGALLDM
ncbi:MAG: 4Fe-4S binding protein [Eubacteriales bacterium]|nr:4Fe-4S binding protein [Eubacteriales bacterium]